MQAQPAPEGPSRLPRLLRPSLLLLPLIGTLATLGLVAAAGVQAGFPSHRFLLWNLFLAWIPLVAAVILYRLRRTVLAWPLGLVWLAFLPNAPYVVTDLIHFGDLSQDVWPWLDLLTLLVAAGTGLALGVLAILYVHAALDEAVGAVSWLFVALLLPAVSFGVYLGRVPRFNSWDVLKEPRQLAELVLERLGAPFEHPLMLWGVVLFTLGLAVSYLVTYLALSRLSESRLSRHSREPRSS